jgi:hypothetical protein
MGNKVLRRPEALRAPARSATFRLPRVRKALLTGLVLAAVFGGEAPPRVAPDSIADKFVVRQIPSAPSWPAGGILAPGIAEGGGS